MILEQIIQGDPVLKYFIQDADINYFNEHQLNVRLNALRLAINTFIDKM